MLPPFSLRRKLSAVIQADHLLFMEFALKHRPTSSVVALLQRHEVSELGQASGLAASGSGSVGAGAAASAATAGDAKGDPMRTPSKVDKRERCLL